MTGIFTLDAVMALVIAMVVLSSCIYLISTPKRQVNERLYDISLDLLAVAGEEHFLQDAVRGDSSGVDRMKAAMPANTCFRIDVKNESGALVYTGGSGCREFGEYALGRRTFASGGGFYVAEMRVWLR